MHRASRECQSGIHFLESWFVTLGRDDSHSAIMQNDTSECVEFWISSPRGHDIYPV